MYALNIPIGIVIAVIKGKVYIRTRFETHWV